MKIPNMPDRPLDFGIIKGQTRLLTTKVMHEGKEPKVMPKWLFALIFVVVVLAISGGIYTMSQSTFFRVKSERMCLEDFKNSPETQGGKIDSIYNNKNHDKELIWSTCSGYFYEEFKAAYTLSDVDRFDGISVNWYGANGLHHNWFYYMAKVDGKWMIAGIEKSIY